MPLVMEGNDLKKILFVCTGNTCRSPMAAGIFNAYAKKHNIDATAYSAGIFVTDSIVNKNAIAVMEKAGIDISAHVPMQFSDLFIDEYDLILTMSPSHRDYLISRGATSTKVYCLCEYVGEDGEVLDPYGGDEVLYAATAENLKRLVEKIEL